MNKVVYRIFFDDEFVGGVQGATHELINEGELVYKPYNMRIFDCNGIRIANFYSRSEIEIKPHEELDERDFYNVYID